MLVMLYLERIQIEVLVFEVEGISHGLIVFFRSLRDHMRDVCLRMGLLLVWGRLVDSHEMVVVGETVADHVVGVVDGLVARVVWVHDVEVILLLLLPVFLELVQIVADHALCLFHPFLHDFLLLLRLLGIALVEG